MQKRFGIVVVTALLSTPMAAQAQILVGNSERGTDRDKTSIDRMNVVDLNMAQLTTDTMIVDNHVS